MPQESINRIVTILAEKLGRITDEPFKRILAVEVDTWRSKLVVNSLEKHPEQRKFFTQTLYIPMENVGEVPCPLPFTFCEVARSKQIVPIPMRIGNTLFGYIGGVDGESSFMEAAAGTEGYLSKGKYSGSTIFWNYKYKKIEIKRFPYMPMIRVDGVFDKPLEVMDYNCRNNSGDCDHWNQPYPVTGDILQMIMQYILEVNYGRKDSRNTQPEVEVTSTPRRDYADS